MVNYAVSDMITRIRNGIRVKKTKVSVLSTNLTKNIAEILKREGFIEEVVVNSTADQQSQTKTVESLERGSGLSRAQRSGVTTFDIYLKYKTNPGQKPQSVVTNLKCMSRPGVRLYANSRQIPQVLGGLGITILSTSKGILTDSQARTLGVGGESVKIPFDVDRIVIPKPPKTCGICLEFA